MIKITLDEIKKLAYNYMLSNTAYSFYEVSQANETIQRLREEYSLDILVQYFKKITSKGKRSEIKIAIAYAILIALLTHKDNYLVDDNTKNFFNRLRWGKSLTDYIEKTSPANNIFSANISLTSSTKNQSIGKEKKYN